MTTNENMDAVDRRAFLTLSAAGVLAVGMQTPSSSAIDMQDFVSGQCRQSKKFNLGKSLPRGDVYISIKFEVDATDEMIDLYLISKEQLKDNCQNLKALVFVGCVIPGEICHFRIYDVKKGSRLVWVHGTKPVVLNSNKIEYQIEYGAEPVPYLE